MPQYYTLEEAAKVLGTTPDELKKMAERNEVRPFRDRGTMRFRGPEIDEMARRRGRGSDAELQLGEGGRAKPSDSPVPQKGAGGEVFDFNLSTDDSDQVEIGQELRIDPSGSKSGKSSKKGMAGPKSPPPKPGSDSDVRLVPDGSDLEFQVASDSDVKLVEPAGPKSAPSMPKSKPDSKPPRAKTGTTPPPKAKTPAPVKRRDSSVKMVPPDSPPVDSDVKIAPDPATDSGVSLGKKSKKAPSDSDVRLEQGAARGGKKGSDDAMLTEEIDLDAELRKAEESGQQRRPKKPKPSSPQLPTTSPFELSESDLDLDAGLPAEDMRPDSSDDFDLTPKGPDDSSPIQVGSDELPAADADEEVTLGELSGQGGKSGINLKDPADSGISLEQGGSSEEIEFELSLDAGSTPKPAPKKPGPEDSSSEFELSLEASDNKGKPAPTPGDSSVVDDSDSEFELSLDADGSSPVGAEADSDSEFELTLDDSGGLAPVEEEAAAAEGESDIFETDFEVPALEEESGSQAVALGDSDTDLETSDFDLALGEEDVAAEEESGSQVVALEDEGEVDESAETQQARRRAKRGGAVIAEDDSSEEVEELFDVSAEGAAAPRGAAVGAPAAPANWGPWPAILMLPCVVFMFLSTLMGLELIRTMTGYRQPSTLTRTLVGTFLGEGELPKGD